MITWGFPPSYSDLAVNDAYFAQSNSNAAHVLAAYLTISGNTGDIVWENNKGEPQWFPNALTGQTYILGAQRILSSATVRGTSRTTTATGIIWSAINTVNNAP